MPESPFHFRPYIVSEDLEAGILRPVRILATETLSRGSRYEVSAICDVGAVDLRSLLRKPTSIQVVRDDGSLVRSFGGVLTRARERATTVEGRQEVVLVIEDPLAMLCLSSDYRIFQELSSKDIVSALLNERGISKFEFRLKGTPRKRVVCTQYGETARAFIDRLLEEDGIAWFVEQGDDGPKLVFADDSSGWSETPGDKTVKLRHGAGLHPEESLESIDLRARVRPTKVTLREHDFEKPALDLEAKAEAETALGREHYEYPGRYLTASEGKTRAKVVLDGHVASATAARVRGAVFRMAAGHSFDLEEAGDSDGTWVVVSVTHEWEHDKKTELVTTAEILPQATHYAPPQRTPKPRALGDLAIVTTPSGDEIHTDKHGRIKVQFLWDRYGKQDDKSSGWVRVGQMHTSGSVVIPRGGWEVYVEYEDGDPDRPIVLGRLYNAASPPTDPLPAGKSNSTLLSYSTPGGGGQNEIRMNDGGGGELVNVYAQKDLNLVVANDKTEKVATTSDVGVKVDEKITVGANEKTKIGSNDTLTVGGSQTYKVGAARTKLVSSDENVTVKGDRSITIAASHTTMTPKSVETTTAGNLTETIGGTNTEVSVTGISMSVAGSTSITVGGAKIEAVASEKADVNIGAKASTIGGALLNVTPKDVTVGTGAVKATTVGGAWMGNAGGDATLTSAAAIEIMVGGAIALTAASKIVMKVGGSSITISAGKVVVDSKEVKLTASGPAAELAPLVGSK